MNSCARRLRLAFGLHAPASWIMRLRASGATRARPPRVHVRSCECLDCLCPPPNGTTPVWNYGASLRLIAFLTTPMRRGVNRHFVQVHVHTMHLACTQYMW